MKVMSSRSILEGSSSYILLDDESEIEYNLSQSRDGNNNVGDALNNLNKQPSEKKILQANQVVTENLLQHSKPSWKLFISNISHETTNEQLKALCENYAKVLETTIIRKTCPFGFVLIDARGGTDKLQFILEKLNGFELDGRKLLVKEADSAKERKYQEKSRKKSVLCYRCGMSGHVALYCRNHNYRKQVHSRSETGYHKLSRYQTCPICPLFVNNSYSSLHEHLISSHPHLVFQCLDDKCTQQKRSLHTWRINEKIHKRYRDQQTKITCFMTFAEMLDHFKCFHNSCASSVQYLFKQGRLHNKCSLPKDLRLAECQKCTTVILCRGQFQIQKHSLLEHGDSNYFNLGCRVCPAFQTTDFSTWHDHFEKDFSMCKGMNLSLKLNDQQQLDIRNDYNKNADTNFCYVCNVAIGHGQSNIGYLEHINGKRQ